MHDRDFLQAIQDTAYWHTAEGVKLPSEPGVDGRRGAGPGHRGGDLRGLPGLLRLLGRALQGRDARAGPPTASRETLDHLANALSAVTDGTILRASDDPAVSVLDHDKRWSPMGLIALAILNSFLERTDNADGLTLEQAVAKHLSVWGVGRLRGLAAGSHSR